MVFFSTEKVQTLDLTLQIQRLKPLSHRGHFLHQFYLWDKSLNFHCPHTALFRVFFKFPLLQQQIVNFDGTLSIKKKMVWGLKFILFKKHHNLCIAVFWYFNSGEKKSGTEVNSDRSLLVVLKQGRIHDTISREG